MKISPSDLSGFDELGTGSEWDGHKLRYIFLHNRWEDLLGIELKRNSFLARWITDVLYLNERGEQVANDWDDTLFKLPDVAKVVVQFNHIEVEYTPAHIERKTSPSLRASNLQINLSDCKKPHDTARYFEERARAALYLVQTAQALGWSEISFDKTTDAYDKLALSMACAHCGMKTASMLDINDLPVRNVVLLPNNAGQNPRAVSYAMMQHAITHVSNGTPDNLGFTAKEYPHAAANTQDAWGDFESAMTPHLAA